MAKGKPEKRLQGRPYRGSREAPSKKLRIGLSSLGGVKKV